MQLPPKENLIRIGVTDDNLFYKRGEMIAESLRKQMEPRGILGPEKKILDFGGGVGCVAGQLSSFVGGATLFCSDVDQSAIDFLVSQESEVIPITNNYNPPLPFGESYFDALYAISVFTHFDPEMEAIWLAELKRVTKPGAWLFISTAGQTTLGNHHQKENNLNITEGMISEEGIVFVEHQLHKKDPSKWPGVTGNYGITYHSLEYIKQTWGRFFAIDDILTPGIVGQDLIILKNNKN